MRKRSYVLVSSLCALSLVACGQIGDVNNGVSQSTATETEPSNESSTIEETSLSDEPISSEASESSEFTEEETSSPPEEASSSHISSTEEGESEHSVSNEELEEKESTEYPGYTNLEVEHARVWLTIRQNHDVDDLPVLTSDELRVAYIPAGTSLYEPYDPNADEYSASWPEATTYLSSGDFGANTRTIHYTSNYDGTVTTYELPNHWGSPYPIGSAEDKAWIAEETQSILDNPQVIEVDPFTYGDILPILEAIEYVEPYQS